MATPKDPQQSLPNDDGAFDTTLVTDKGVPVVASVLKFGKPKDKSIFPEDAKPQYRLGERIVFLCEGRVTKAGLEADPDWTTDEDKPGDMTRVQHVSVTRMRVLSPTEALATMGKLGMKPGAAAKKAKAAEAAATKAAQAKADGDELAAKRAAKAAEEAAAGAGDATGELDKAIETADTPKPLAKMSKAELLEVAELEGVDLSDARNNGTRVLMIEEARKSRADGDPNPPADPLPEPPVEEEPAQDAAGEEPEGEGFQPPSPAPEDEATTPADFDPLPADPVDEAPAEEEPARGVPVVPASERVVYTEVQLLAMSADQLRGLLSKHGVPSAAGDIDTLVSMVLTLQEPEA